MPSRDGPCAAPATARRRQREMLLISGSDVKRLLPMRECIEVMSAALRAHARGAVTMPLRTVIPLKQNRGAFAAMPAVLDAPDTLGIKVISVYPGNHGTDLDSHQGAVLLFEPEHGSLVAIVDAAAITALRTAAVSGVATRALANQDTHTLAILGSGVQARTHLDAMLAVRKFKKILVWSRNAASAQLFAGQESGRTYLNIEPAESVEVAVSDADVICTVTSSREPVLRGEWLRAGVHINAVGASTRASRELDSAAVKLSRVFVDSRESALSEAGDLLIPIAEGVISAGDIAGELGAVLEGLVPGRGSQGEMTLFKSLGLAIEDVAAAHHVYASASADPGVARVEL